MFSKSYYIFILFATILCNQSVAQSILSQSRFYTVSDGLSSSRVQDMTTDSSNIIWLRMSDEIQLWDGQSMLTVPDSNHILSSPFSIFPNNDGIYVICEKTLYQVTYNQLYLDSIYSITPSIPYEKFTLVESGQNPHILIFEKGIPIQIVDINNNITTPIDSPKSWIGSNVYYSFYYNGSCLLYCKKENRILKLPEFGCEQELQAILPNRIRYNIATTDSTLIIAEKSGIIISSENAVNLKVAYPNNAITNYYASIHQLNDNSYLVGVDNQLFVFDSRHLKWTGTYVNPNKRTVINTGFYDKLILDKYQNIWAITVNEGILKIYNQQGISSFKNHELDNNFIKNITLNEDEDLILTSGLNNGITVFDTLGDIKYILDSSNNDKITSVSGIFPLSKNTYLFNQYNDPWSYKLTLTSSEPYVEKLVKRSSSYLYYQDFIPRDENTFYCLFLSLFEYDYQKNILEPLLLYSGNKPSMALVSDTLWLSTNNAIVRYLPDTRTIIDTLDLPRAGFIRSIQPYLKNKMACSTDDGVYIIDRSNGKAKRITEDCGYCLLTNEENIWIGTGTGIAHYSPHTALRYFTKEDGINNSEFNTNACIKASNGRMFFGGLSGITSFHPEDMDMTTDKPKLSIKELFINDSLRIEHQYFDDSSPQLNLEYYQNNIRIKIGAYGEYDSDKYNYQYFVEGLTSEWVDGKDQTQYDFIIQPGAYKMYFHASNNFSPNAVKSQYIQIQINKAWWQQWWFYTLLALSLMGVAGTIIYLIQRQFHIKEKFNWQLKHELQEERIQMSKELHDNIGSRLSFLVSALHGIKSSRNQDSTHLNERVDELSDYGKRTINDLRSMMWVLKQESINALEFELKVLDFLSIARQSAPTTEILFNGISEHYPTLEIPAKISQNSFRIIQEAVHNALKHAKAKNIEISISYRPKTFMVKIEDNGQGFAIEQVTTTGYGLQNIQDRCSSINGQLNIVSAPSRGTCIEFKIML